MDHPERCLIAPDQFIQFAEKTGAIQRLTQWVLKSAIGQAMVWRRGGLSVQRIPQPIGVEDQETWNASGALGCDEAQG